MVSRELSRKLKLCQDYKQQIISYMEKIDSQLSSGNITYEKHLLKQSRFLRGRTERWWNDYLAKCEIKLRNGKDVNIISPREPYKPYPQYIVIAIAILGLLLFTQYTGLVIFTQEQTAVKDVSLTFTNASRHEISLDYNPISLKVSGTYNGTGNFKLYLEANNNLYLVADKPSLSNNLITGLAVDNQTNATTSVETTSTIQENLTTTIIQNITTTTIVNITTSVETTSIETTSSILESQSFSSICVETCSLSNISSNIKLVAFIDSGSLEITRISYSYAIEENIITTSIIENVTLSSDNQTFEILAESATSNYFVYLKKTNLTLNIYGANASDFLGRDVATLDINNDTALDILTSGYSADTSAGADAGEVYVIYGRNYTDKKIINLDISRANITIRGANASDSMGTDLSSGDINDDGLPDIIISAAGADPPGGSLAGEVYIIYGSKNYGSGKIIDLNTVNANITVRGNNLEDSIGDSVASSDINNDGISDVIIGASSADPVTGADAGEVYVIYGKSNYAAGKIIDLNTVNANITIKGNNTNFGLGDRVASGDINNDGIKDILIGASNADPPAGDEAGTVYVIYGKNYGNGKVITLFGTNANITIIGDDALDSLTVVSSSDINNDGIEDIIAKSGFADPPGGNNAGEVYVIYGSANYGINKVIDLGTVNANITIRGNDADDSIGTDVGTGDINSDGIKDIIIGAIGADTVTGISAGEVYVIYGSANYGNNKIIDLNTVNANITISGAKASEQIGMDVSVGNVNNVSGVDIVIGSQAAAPSGTDGGGVFVFHGNEVAPVLLGNNTINNTSPFPDAKLKCLSGFYSDGNYDSNFKSYWKWFINNQLITYPRMQEFNLTNVTTEAVGDLIRCSQKVSDGYLNSSWYNSTPAQIVQPSSVVTTPVAGRSTSAFGRRTAEIVTPEPIKMSLRDTTAVTLKIRNNRNIPLRGVTLSAKSNTPDITPLLLQERFEIINPGEEISIDMILESHSTPGTYFVDINLNVTQPMYQENSKLYIDLVESGSNFNSTVVVTRIAFAKDLFKENPECLELQELLTRAEEELAINNLESARDLTEQAVSGCKDLITTGFIQPEVQKPKSNTNLIFIIALISVILAVLVTYSILRRNK